MPIPFILTKTANTPKSSEQIQTILRDLKHQNPKFDIRYYDNEQCAAFIAQHFEPRVLVAFKALIPGAYKADLFRYCAMYIHGGVYGDIKQRYLKPLDEIFDMQADMILWTRDILRGNIQISFMASPPKHPIFRKAIDFVVETVFTRAYRRSCLDVTGPGLMREVLRAMPEAQHKCICFQKDHWRLNLIHQESSTVVETKHFALDTIMSGSYGHTWRSGSGVFDEALIKNHVGRAL